MQCKLLYINSSNSVVNETDSGTVTSEAAAVETVVADAVIRSDSVDTRRELTASAIVAQTLVYICRRTHQFTTIAAAAAATTTTVVVIIKVLLCRMQRW